MNDFMSLRLLMILHNIGVRTRFNMEFKKIMTLPIASLIFLVMGTILATLVTMNYRADVLSKQEKIEELNVKLQNSVNSNYALSTEIIGVSKENMLISETTSELVSKNKALTEKIDALLVETDKVVRRNQEIATSNGELTVKVQVLAEKIEDFQTGGDSYPKYSIVSNTLKPYFVRIGISIKGNNPLYIQSHSISNSTLYKELFDSKGPPEEIRVSKEFFEQHMHEQEAIARTMPYLKPGMFNAGLIDHFLGEMYLDPRLERYTISFSTLASNGQFDNRLLVEKAKPEGAWMATQYIVTKSNPTDPKLRRTTLELEGDYFLKKN